LLLARGLAAIGKQSRLIQGMLVILLVAFLAAGWFAQASHAIKSDFRGAAQLVAEGHQAGDLIVFQIPYGRYTFEYYYRSPFESADGLYTNHQVEGGYLMGESEVDRQMRALTAGRQTVWLVGTEMEMWDQRHLVLQWLQTYGQQTLEQGLARVTVWRFDMAR